MTSASAPPQLARPHQKPDWQFPCPLRAGSRSSHHTCNHSENTRGAFLCVRSNKATPGPSYVFFWGPPKAMPTAQGTQNFRRLNREEIPGFAWLSAKKNPSNTGGKIAS